MAQNQWFNATVDPNAAGRPDRQNQYSKIVQGTAAANDLTLSFDSAKFTSVTMIRGALDDILVVVSGQLPP